MKERSATGGEVKDMPDLDALKQKYAPRSDPCLKFSPMRCSIARRGGLRTYEGTVRYGRRGEGYARFGCIETKVCPEIGPLPEVLSDAMQHRSKRWTSHL